MLAPLAWLRGPMLLCTAMWAVLPTCAPGVWRAMRYWQRALPLGARYLRTSRRCVRACMCVYVCVCA